jgi:hypothetical protein
MKQFLKQTATKVTLFAAVLLAAFVFPGSANAQSMYSAKFTLQHSVRWGQTTLGAGEYTVNINRSGGTTTFIAVIYYVPNGKVAATVNCASVDDATKGESALLIGQRGKLRVVHSFRVEELRKTFIFDRTLASQQGAEEAMTAEDVPVLELKK